jgi:hypothetical protein
VDTVTVDKIELTEKIEANRAKHRAIFEEAVVGYRNQAIQMLEEHISRIKAGRVMRVHVVLPEPEDHTGDYDRVLAMLAMHQGDSIVIGQHDFASYVLDDWAWKKQFLTTNSSYSPTAMAALGN